MLIIVALLPPNYYLRTDQTPSHSVEKGKIYSQQKKFRQINFLAFSLVNAML